jgi:hypothetical protein
MAADMVLTRDKKLSPYQHIHMIVGACRVGDIMASLESVITAEVNTNTLTAMPCLCVVIAQSERSWHNSNRIAAINCMI